MDPDRGRDIQDVPIAPSVGVAAAGTLRRLARRKGHEFLSELTRELERAVGAAALTIHRGTMAWSGPTAPAGSATQLVLPLPEVDGTSGGVLAMVFDDPVVDTGFARALLELFAPLITLELERAVLEETSPCGPDLRTRLDQTRRRATDGRRLLLERVHSSLARSREPDIQPIDVVPLFVDAVDSFRPSTPPVVIEHPEHCIVEADPDLMAIVIDELVANAIRHAMERAEIRLALGSRPGCSFYLRDNGVGITASRAQAIFRAPDARGDSGRDRIRLADVERIVTRHMGKVWAEGEPGWGATICIALPPAA